MKRYLIIGGLAVLLLALSLPGWLLYSESGLQWVYRQALAQVPGDFSSASVGGRLAGPITLQDVRYRGEAEQIAARRLRVEWNPWALLRAELDLERVEADGLEVRIESEPTPPSASAPALPEIDLPLRISLRSLEVDQLKVIQGERLTEIARVETAAWLRQAELGIDALVVEYEDLRLRLQGTVETGPELAHDLGIDWNGRLPSGEAISGQGRLAGTLERTRLEHRFDGALRGDLELELANPVTRLEWQARLNLADVESRRLDGALPPLAGDLRLEARGDLQALSASGALELEQSPYGPQSTRFSVARVRLADTADGLTFERLELDLLQGKVLADGAVDWVPQLQWRTQLTTTGLDPAAVLPQWPGRIDASLGISGAIEPGGPALALEIERLDGELRGYPVALRGAVQWRERQARLSGIELESGGSRAALDGSLGDELDLSWSLQSSDLAELYPGLRGELGGEGRVDGRLEAAALAASLRGRAIEYADYAAASIDAELGLGLDLSRPQAPGLLRIEVAAEAAEVRLQELQLQRVALEADETRLHGEIAAAAGEARVELEGRLENERWQGKLVAARIRSADYGEWRLAAPAALDAALNGIGIGGLCLDNAQNGRLCADLQHRDNAGKADLELRRLPLGLFQRWMPAGLTLTSLADAEASFDYELPGRLHGRLEIDIAPGQVGYELAPGQPEVVEFEGARLQMRLAESGIEASYAVELGGDDGLRGTVDLPRANLLDLDLDSQDLRARLQLRLRDLGLIDSRIAYVDRLRGIAEVDLDISGNLSQPRMQGSARLDDATLYLPELDLEITQLRVDADSADLRHLRYRAEARVADGRVALAGSTELDADAGWPSQLRLDAEQLLLSPLLRERLPQDLGVDGRVDVAGDLILRAQQRLGGTLRLTSSSGSLSYPLPNGESGRWNYRDVELAIVLDAEQLRANGGFDIGDNKLEIGLRLPGFDPFRFDAQGQALDGEVKLAFDDLSLLETLLPDVQNARGSLRVNLRIAGKLAQPRLLGNAEMRQASAQIGRLGLKLEQVDLTAATDAEGLLTFDASAISGGGKLGFKGTSRLDAGSGWPTVMEISGEDFLAARIPEATVRLSPRLEVRVADRSIDVSGEILVPYAKLRPRDVTMAAKVSNDVVIVGEEQVNGRRWKITSNLRLILGERVTFFGYGFDGRLGGNLVIQEEPGKPTRGTGEITIPEGRYRAYGQHLDVEEGRLLYSGGPLTNPGLDIRAVRVTGDVTAGIKVSGRLRSPRLDLFSIPAMGETDTLSYLLTGGPLDSASSGEGAMLSQAALALGLSGGDRIARTIGDRFGFDEMRIESSSSGDQASLVVGRYLSPRLYVGYGVGLIESINTFNLRYKVTERWQLEAESGEHQGADLFYRFER